MGNIMFYELILILTEMKYIYIYLLKLLAKTQLTKKM